jgi:NAD(P)-dependent dehydrogenase (short-subunit alcohol dehydrogenase family)
VLCADVNQNAANETVEIIRQENDTANAIRAGVTSHDEIRRMVKACMDTYGRIDIVDYNVGLAHVGGRVEIRHVTGLQLVVDGGISLKLS